MGSLNQVVLLGNLTRDPEVRSLPSGQTVTELGLAMNRKFTVNGETREEVTFVDCTAWGRTGEVVAQYLHKGDPLAITGRLKLDQWEAKDGSKRSKITVVVQDATFVGGQQGGQTDRGPGGASRGGGRPAAQPSGGDDLEGFDEVPF